MKLALQPALFSAEAASVNWGDARLVRACLAGDEQAWAALIEKYKNLVYSIPIKYGAVPDDAADIFQAVWMEVFAELPKLRKPDSLRSWLISITAHKAYHWKRKLQQHPHDSLDESDSEQLAEDADLPPQLVEEVEEEQLVREAIARLPERCQEMIRLLFYEVPPLPYQQVAERLGLATGSIGFIRGRCLQRLQKLLKEGGLRP